MSRLGTDHAVPTVPLCSPVRKRRTTRVNAEQERRRLLDAAVAAALRDNANGRRMSFAPLSHELRTPLNAIVGWTRMLLDGILDESSTRRALTIIDRNAHAQAQLVTELLDVSRIVTGKLTLNVVPLDLGSVVGAALDTIRPAADAKRIRLTSKMSRSARLIMGDFQRLQQVVWNLLSNAVNSLLRAEQSRESSDSAASCV